MHRQPTALREVHPECIVEGGPSWEMPTWYSSSLHPCSSSLHPYSSSLHPYSSSLHPYSSSLRPRIWLLLAGAWTPFLALYCLVILKSVY